MNSSASSSASDQAKLRSIWNELPRYAQFRIAYWAEPASFVRRALRWADGQSPAAYQLDILDSLVAGHRVSVRGPHGLGKTTVMAWATLWFALTRNARRDRDWKIGITASSWHQVKDFLWPEIHKWARRIDWAFVGRPAFTRDELLQLNIKLDRGLAFGTASNRHELMEGAHADELLYIFDEAKGIPAEMFDALEGAFAGGGAAYGQAAYVLCFSTPGPPLGRFYEIQRRAPGLEDWRVRHVSLDEALAAGRISPSWVEQRRRQWGESSALYRNRVLGEFHAGDEDGVVPLAWYESAVARWHEMKSQGAEAWPITKVGVDVARFGDDQSAICIRRGDFCTFSAWRGLSTMELVGQIRSVVSNQKHIPISVDVIGIGGGVYDRLKEDGFYVQAFNASSKTERVDQSGEIGFINRRAAAYWNLRRLLDPEMGAGLSLPEDEILAGDLSTLRYRLTSSGNYQMEPKEDFRKRFGRSPDMGDALVIACDEEDDSGWQPEDIRAL